MTTALARHSGLVLKHDTPKGRAVFASTDIPSGAVLETCAVLVLSDADNRQHIEKTELFHYTFNWPSAEKGKTLQALVLGLGSMFNHSTQHQNVGWYRDIQKQIMTYYALHDIAEGEELCISYGSRLTFVDVDVQEIADEGDGSQLLNNIDLG